MGQEGKDALKDFKEFWAKYNAYELLNEKDNTNTIHPEDSAAVTKNSKKYQVFSDGTTKNSIKPNAIIINEKADPYCGDIENAKFIILSGNPGFNPANPEDYSKMNLEAKYKASPKIDLNKKSFDYLYNKKQYEGAWGYWNPKFQVIIKECAQKLGIKYPNYKNEEKITKEIAKKTCLLESVCYASKNSPNIGPTKLQSSKLIKNLLHEYLIPKAQRGEILIFSWRSSSFWGIKECIEERHNKELGQSEKKPFHQKWIIKYYIEGNIIIRGGSVAQNGIFTHEESSRIAEFLIKAIREDRQNT